MNVKEKLVELLYKMFDKTFHMSVIEGVADYLIAKGVTFETDNHVGGKWIPVTERLPTKEDANESESILAIRKDERYVGRWLWDIVAEYPKEFTHWTHLPELPKEVE